MSFSFTPSQTAALESRGGTLLVSAAAGSGKTRVLTQRLLNYVSDPVAPVDIDRFLVITFTRAAAAEMRSRILESLAELAAEHPADTRLRRQQSLCCRASIGTIHSFCTTVLREYSSLLGLSPSFAVVEEDRAEQLMLSVAARLLERHYGQIDTDERFRLLVDTVGAGQDDRQLQSTLLSLYKKLCSHPYPDDWAEAQKTALSAEGVTRIDDTVWGAELMESAKRTAEFWAETMESAAAEMEQADDGGVIYSKYGESFLSAAEQLRDLRRALDEGWDRARSFCSLEPPARKRLVNYADAALKDRMSALWTACTKACGKLKSCFSQDSAAELRDLRAAAPAMCALLDLAIEFEREYAAEKQRRGLLDFSDLEHYTVRLLVDKATGAPTWVAVELSHRFTEIMVDEYQDVNAVQELIFRAISRENGKNLFLVGDVKQSIYRFRLADPGLFLEKYRSFVSAAEAVPGQPRRVDLQENFRSRRTVLDAANLVFRNLMSAELGDLDYDDAAALKFGSDRYDAALDVPAELHIIRGGSRSEDEEEPPQSAELEARFVAEKILSMVRAGTSVTTDSGTRPCNFGDFVLLMRSPKGKGKAFYRVLESCGIPVESRQGGGFFTSLEVSTIIDLMEVIDNPHADVPLISVLRSPAFGFTADELSAIRVADRNSDFYSALCAAAAGGSVRCNEFLSRLNVWRALAPEIGLDTLVWRLCSDTGMFAISAAMGGGQRRQNLMQLFAYAGSFDEGGYKGLFRFVRWLRRMAEKGQEPEISVPGQAVRIMSIHKSKGLEFPFVFLCDLSPRFNTDDVKSRVLLHAELGLGPRVVDTARGLLYPTVAHRAISRRLITEMMSEEMRVLYVAMTRAKEQLIMSCVWNDPEKQIEKLLPLVRSPLPPEFLRANASFAKWLYMAASLDPELISVSVHNPAADETAAPATAAAQPGPDEVSEALERLQARLDYQYPRAGAVDLPSKLTATELKTAAEDDMDAASALPPETELCFRHPTPGAGQTLNAAQRGTAAHTFLQYADLSRVGSATELRQEALRLTAAGRLTQQEADVLQFSSLEKFFASPLGQRLRAAEAPRREFRFLLLAKAEEYFPTADGEELLLQGVVDCCFVENGGITVLDYKTDRVTAEQVPLRAARYRGQLQTYAKALERIFRLPVKHCILWFLHPGAEYEVELSED